jgi:hypothetical protein
MAMTGWQRDLLDHLAWLTVLHAERDMTVEDAIAQVQRELPRLRLPHAEARFLGEDD